MLTHANLVANLRQIELANPIDEDGRLPLVSALLAHVRTHGRALRLRRARERDGVRAFRGDDRAGFGRREAHAHVLGAARSTSASTSGSATNWRKRTKKRRYLTEWAEEAGWRRFAKNDLPVEPHRTRENLDDTVAQMLDDEVGAKIREIFGGRLRATFAGGASLNYTVAKFFSAMGLNILHSYGLTETSPIVSMSTPDGNHPACVGFPSRAPRCVWARWMSCR